MTIYEVKTYGGQIISDQKPTEVQVSKQFEPLVKEAMSQTGMGFFWMDGANYYDTMEHAERAIRWALSN